MALIDTNAAALAALASKSTGDTYAASEYSSLLAALKEANAATRSANTVFAGPASGSSAAAAFRALVASDIPSLAASKISDFSTAADARIAAAVGASVQGYSALLAAIAAGSVSSTEFGYLDGVTSSIQDQIDALSGGGATDLDGLSDVALTSPAEGDFLYYDGAAWVNSILVAADVTDFNTAADNRIAAAVGSTVQAYDADLAAVAGLSATGFVQRTGAGTFSAAALVDGDIPASIARDSEVTSAISALSSVYQPLDADLTAIAALTTTGVVQRTGANTWAAAALLAADIPSLTAAKISDFSTAADARISAAVGVSVQAWDADLDTWAGKTAPSGAVVGTSDAQTLTSKTLTTPTIASFANATHTHADAAGGGTLGAAAIASGTIATARLGSGTADATTYLRGDQTWATVSATPAGSGTELQYRNSTALGAVAGSAVAASGAVTFAASDTATTGFLNALTLGHNSSNTPTGSTFGTALVFQAKTDTTANTDMARIAAQWTTVTHASRTSAITWSGVNNAGALTEQLRLTGGGDLLFTDGAGTFDIGFKRIGAFSLRLTAGGASNWGNLEASTVYLHEGTSSTVGMMLDLNGAVGRRFALGNNYTIAWTNSVGAGGTADIGLERAAANVLKINNGSTGIGQLMCATMVAAKTAAYSVTASDSRCAFTNEGATSGVVLTLPSAAAGYCYTFVVQDTDGLTITAAAGDTIRIEGSVSAAAGTCAATTIGNTITLLAINATEWVSVGKPAGTWTLT